MRKDYTEETHGMENRFVISRVLLVETLVNRSVIRVTTEANRFLVVYPRRVQL